MQQYQQIFKMATTESKATSRVISFRKEDGTSLFTWVAYSHYPDGTNPSLSPILYEAGLTDDNYSRYLGMAYNKQTSSPGSLRKEDYVWMPIQGQQGKNGYTVNLSSTFTGIPTDNDGNPTDLSYAKTRVRVYRGNIEIRDFTTKALSHDGVNYTYNEILKEYTVTGLVQDVGKIVIEVTVDGDVISIIDYNLAKMYGVNSLKVPTTVRLDLDQLYFISYERKKGETFMTPISYLEYEAYDTSVKIANKKIGSNLSQFTEDLVGSSDGNNVMTVKTTIEYVGIDLVHLEGLKILRDDLQVLAPNRFRVFNVNKYTTKKTGINISITGIHYVHTE